MYAISTYTKLYNHKTEAFEDEILILEDGFLTRKQAEEWAESEGLQNYHIIKL